MSEMNERQFTDKFIEGYYKPLQEGNALPLALSIKEIAQKISFPNIPTEEMERIAYQSILESPSPEDLKTGSVELITTAIQHGMKVIIWTVGDKGEFIDKKNGITYPAHNFQLIKINGSGLELGVTNNLIKSGIDPQIMDFLFKIDISNEHKKYALKNIFEELVNMGYEEAYLGDDQQKNTDDAKVIATDFPLKLHDWWINNQHPAGNLEAFLHYFTGSLQDGKDKSKSALILDFDDTLYDEQQRNRRAAIRAFILAQKFKKT